MQLTRYLPALIACLVSACSEGGSGRSGEDRNSPEVGGPSRLGVLQEEGGALGFAVADRPYAFSFPRDHGPHPAYRHEWWYVTGNLDAADGSRFGFELTFFRVALAPDATQPASEQSSAWRTNQIYAAHFAVTDLQRKRFRFDSRYSREALGLAGAQGEPFRVWIDDWSLGSDASGEWTLRASAHGYALDLNVTPLMAPVLNGEAGLSRRSDAANAASYYYSVPRLAVRGTLTRDGVAVDVQGLAWLDREWGSGSLAPDQVGWDWFALQLDDGSALMVYSWRWKDGSQHPASAGTWTAPDGSYRQLTPGDVQIDITDHWVSPRGGRYPARWRLRVPAAGLDIEVRPVLADQELQTNPRYWEGAVDVQGTRNEQKVAGRGYVELVGYAREHQR